ncbi:restriction endonuclease subunit S [Streptomyces bobili]|uniref:restriction endonuclease subunit S n=1 Tax=Streptomyces bobili TaxID=67280 RepID=UPI0022562A99|nr:restriction endonuclease subunit S [Streptomyces bobili]MCX5527684.1 restriction endonuclease subunit S [Streptomyces bobili]
MNFPTTKLKWVATTTAGGTPSVAEPSFWSDDDEEGLPWVSIGDMSGRAWVTTTGRRVTSAGVSAARLPVGDPGTLLLSMYASLGHTAFLTTRATWNQAILGINVSPSHEVRFIKYALEAIKPTLTEFARSNTQANLNAEQVGNLVLPEPPRDSQRRIADFLDKEIARTDRIVDSQVRLISLLKEREATAVEVALSEVATGSVRLKHLLVAPPSYGANEPAENVRRDWPRYIRTTDIDEDGSLREETFASLPPEVAGRYLLNHGDILFVRSGATTGKAFVYENHRGPAAHAGYLIKARMDQHMMLPRLVWHFCQTRAYWQQISEGTVQSTIQNVNAEKYGNLLIPWIEPSRQEATLQQIDSVVRRSRKLQERARQLLSVLAERRQALITAAVTGQFDVSTASGRNVTEGVTV